MNNRSSNTPQRGRILVVEDDAAIREMVAEMLHDEGYAVVCAADGADALRLLQHAKEAPPGLILLDWRMPTPGGVFAQAYRELPPPHAPIVVITAMGDVVDAAVEINAHGFLRKPFDVQELLEIVERFFPTNGPVSPEVPAASAAPPAAAPPTSAMVTPPANTTPTANATGRYRPYLERVRQEIGEVQASLASVQPQVRELAEIEESRRLQLEEAQRLRTLRWESERLSLQLQRLRQEFAAQGAPKMAERKRQGYQRLN
jgi:DNA-binding response OmpR family regulator